MTLCSIPPRWTGYFIRSDAILSERNPTDPSTLTYEKRIDPDVKTAYRGMEKTPYRTVRKKLDT